MWVIEQDGQPHDPAAQAIAVVLGGEFEFCGVPRIQVARRSGAVEK